MKTVTLILSALVLLAVLGAGGFFYLAQKSKTGNAPGLADGVLSPCPSSPNCVVSETHADDKHRVAPLPLKAWGEAPGVIEAMGGVVVVRDEGYIAATFASKAMGFVDDVELRKADNAVHIRSASRVGYSDGGVNRARVEQLRSLLDRSSEG